MITKINKSLNAIEMEIRLILPDLAKLFDLEEVAELEAIIEQMILVSNKNNKKIPNAIVIYADVLFLLFNFHYQLKLYLKYKY